jgi:hypothetical protein
MATLSAYALLTCYPSDIYLCHGFMRYDVDLEILSAPRVSSLANRLRVHIYFGLGCSSTGEPLQVWSPSHTLFKSSNTSTTRISTFHLCQGVAEWQEGKQAIFRILSTSFKFQYPCA